MDAHVLFEFQSLKSKISYEFHLVHFSCLGLGTRGRLRMLHTIQGRREALHVQFRFLTPCLGAPLLYIVGAYNDAAKSAFTTLASFVSGQVGSAPNLSRPM